MAIDDTFCIWYLLLLNLGQFAIIATFLAVEWYDRSQR